MADNHDIIATWHLAGFAETTAEVRLIGEDSDQADIDGWLNATGEALAAATAPATGLILTIGPDLRFAERCDGTPRVPWFDAEGVLAEAVAPFDGTVTGAGGLYYIRPDTIASWAMPVEGRHGAAMLRHDDGDTKIADALTVRTDRLVRSVNVVTDELYLHRVVLLYTRAGT